MAVEVLYVNSIMNDVNYRFLHGGLPALGGIGNISFMVYGNRGSTSNGKLAPISTGRLFSDKISTVALNGRSFHEGRICSYLSSGPFVIEPTGFPRGSAPNGNVVGISAKQEVISVVGVVNGSCVSGGLGYTFRYMSGVVGRTRDGVVVISFRTRTANRGETVNCCLSNEISTVFKARARIRASSTRILPGKANCVASAKVANAVRSILNMGDRVVVTGLGGGLPRHFSLTGKRYGVRYALFSISSGDKGYISTRSVHVRWRGSTWDGLFPVIGGCRAVPVGSTFFTSG